MYWALAITGLLGVSSTLWALWRGSAAVGEAKALREKIARYEYAAGKADEAFLNVSRELDLTRTEMAEQVARREAVIKTLKERIANVETLLSTCSTPGAALEQLRDLFSGE